jgi:raffinose/stachyose/melibiose transport system substrate-binding protein
MKQEAVMKSKLAIFTAGLGILCSTAAVMAQDVAEISWVDQSRGDIDQKIDELFVAPFNTEHPNIKLTITRQEDQENFVRMSVQARNAPDILQLNGASEVADLARAKRIVAMDDYSKKYGWDKLIQPWALESGVVDGKLYSLPLTYESMVLYFNKATFEKLGIAIPKDYAGVVAACEAAMAKDVVCFANSTGGKPSRGEWFSTWQLNAAVGPKVIYDVLKGTQPASALAPALKQNIDWIKNGWYSKRSDLYLTLGADEAWGQIAGGQALMRVSGSWELSRIKKFCEADCDWSMMPTLSDAVKPNYPLGVGETLSISADSKNPDATAEVLNALFTNKARSAQLLNAISFETWVVPVDWNAEDFPADTDPRYSRFIVDLADKAVAGDIGYTTWTFFPPKTRNYLFEAMETVLIGGLSIDDFIAGIQPLLDAERDSIPALPTPKAN